MLYVNEGFGWGDDGWHSKGESDGTEGDPDTEVGLIG